MGRARGAGAATALVSLLLTAGCVAPVAGLWPLPSPRAARAIVVSLDTWHAMIAFPLDSGGEPPVAGERGEASARDRPSVAEGARFEEWGYAERGWYLEGRAGVGGALRALLWPSPGVVEVAVSDRIWAERTPQPPAEVYRFELSTTGYQRLRDHLRSTIAPGEPVVVLGASRFYPARDAYHLLHQCHQYAARALREAGLPVWPFGALSRSALAAQLRRAARIAAERVPAPEAPGPPR